MMFLDGGLQLPSHRSAIIRFSSYIYNSRVFCRAWKVRSGRLTQPASWYWWLSSRHTSASTGPGESETKVKVTQSCPTLCESMDCIVHGILQVRILEWVAFPFSQGSSRPRSQTGVSCIVGGFFSNWAIRKNLGMRLQIPTFLRSFPHLLTIKARRQSYVSSHKGQPKLASPNTTWVWQILMVIKIQKREKSLWHGVIKKVLKILWEFFEPLVSTQ